jgi:hypothetical protein
VKAFASFQIVYPLPARVSAPAHSECVHLIVGDDDTRVSLSFRNFDEACEWVAAAQAALTLKRERMEGN